MTIENDAKISADKALLLAGIEDTLSQIGEEIEDCLLICHTDKEYRIYYKGQHGSPKDFLRRASIMILNRREIAEKMQGIGATNIIDGSKTFETEGIPGNG